MKKSQKAVSEVVAKNNPNLSKIGTEWVEIKDIYGGVTMARRNENGVLEIMIPMIKSTTTTTETKKRKVNIYLCANCGAKQKNGYIRAMDKAGWSLWHLSCDTCGQQEIFQKQ